MGDHLSVATSHQGAYGLRLTGVRATQLLVDSDPSWPELSLQTTIAPTADGAEYVDDDHAVIHLRTGGSIALDRLAGTAVYSVPRPLDDEELIHPFLAPAAAVMSYWLNRGCFHAGVVSLNGRAWGVLGDREAGKSTLLAWLALGGESVLADDLLVVAPDSGDVFAGPRSIDLRRATAERLGIGDDKGVLGARERWRVNLGPVPPRVQLAGWIFLAWDDHISLVDIGGSVRVVRLAAQGALTLSPRDPLLFLELASLPCFELRRPRDWSALEASTELLLRSLPR